MNEGEDHDTHMEILAVCYELAKAYYTIKNYSNAVKYGQKAYEQADKLNHQIMATKSRIIVGQAQCNFRDILFFLTLKIVSIKDFNSAVKVFTIAMNLVKGEKPTYLYLQICRSLDNAKRLKA